MPAPADQWSQIPHDLLAQRSRSLWSSEKEEPALYYIYEYILENCLMQQQFTIFSNTAKMAQPSFGDDYEEI